MYFRVKPPYLVVQLASNHNMVCC